MSWHELSEPPILGLLNEHIFVVHDDSNRRVLMRSPKKNLDLLQSIKFEYGYMGFIGAGGEFRLRSSEEQFLFSRKAAESGLCVLPPLGQQNDRIYYPFVSDAKTLDLFLEGEKGKAIPVVNQLVEDLYRAHAKGFVYGDRWSHNILIHPRFGLIHIDFDLEINGPYAKEFEIAQVAYYTLSAGRKEVLLPLAQLLGSHTGWFNFGMVDLFMRRHATYFNDTPYGGIQSETETFLGVLCSIVKH
jgi:hypothetical protein